MKLNMKKKKKAKQAKSSGGLKMALLTHAEKIVIGLTAGCVAWLIYGATKLESLPQERQPPALQIEARKAKDNIDKLNYGSFPDEKKPFAKPYDQAAVMKDINPTTYETTVPLNPPEFPRKTPRKDPKLFTIEALEAVAGVGLFAFKGSSADSTERRRGTSPPPRKAKRKRKSSGRNGAGDKSEDAVVKDREDSELQQLVGRNAVRLPAEAVVKGRYWAAVLAKVPWSKQTQEYQRTLRDAEYYRPDYDVPVYVGYVVERAEVGDGDKLQWKVVKQITLRALDKILSEWAGEPPEPADLRYVHELLTFPLPIRVEKAWDDSVLHSDVPPARRQSGSGREEAVAAEGNDETENSDESTDGFGNAFERRAAGSGGHGRSGGGRGRFRSGGDAGEEEGRGPRARGGQGPGRTIQPRSLVKQVPFLFFRFVDFDVQPGKQYKYRVSLALSDPNDTESPDPRAAIPPRYLGEKVISRRSKLKGSKLHFRLTDWSDPSPVVSVPYPGWLLAGPVKAARPEKHYDEPAAAMIVQMLDLQQGLEGVTEIPKMRRGTVGNFVKTTQVIEYGRRGPTVRQEDNFEFRTNTVLLDLHGGEGLSRRDRSLTAPGEVLLLDPSGRLIVRTEQSDRDEFARLQRLLEASKPHRSRGTEEKKADRQGEGGLFGDPGGGGSTGRRRPRRNR